MLCRALRSVYGCANSSASASCEAADFASVRPELAHEMSLRILPRHWHGAKSWMSELTPRTTFFPLGRNSAGPSDGATVPGNGSLSDHRERNPIDPSRRTIPVQGNGLWGGQGGAGGTAVPRIVRGFSPNQRENQATIYPVRGHLRGRLQALHDRQPQTSST